MIPSFILDHVKKADSCIQSIMAAIGTDPSLQSLRYYQCQNEIHPAFVALREEVAIIKDFLVAEAQHSRMDYLNETFISDSRTMTLQQWFDDIQQWIFSMSGLM